MTLSKWNLENKMSNLFRLVACLFLCISLNSFGALYDRGNGLIYDDILNITWLQDANYPFTSGYAAANAVGSRNSTSANIQTDGAMGWDAAKTWAAQLVYGGYDDWRLASANLMNAANPCSSGDGTCDQGPNNTTSELGHMFYNNLGNTSGCGIIGLTSGCSASGNITFTDAGPDGGVKAFVNVQDFVYWLSEASVPYSSRAWAFYSSNGSQGLNGKLASRYSWAVRDGDVITSNIDTDGDGAYDHQDNCPSVFNASQSNIDFDTLGDACDPDMDGDGLFNVVELKFGGDETDNTDANVSQNNIVTFIETAPADSDLDGIIDSIETAAGTSNSDPSDGDQAELSALEALGINKQVPAMGGIGLLALGLSMLGLGAVRLRRK